MQKLIKIHTIFIFCFLGTSLIAQKENNNWYFGFRLGLNFNTTPPTVLTNGKTNAIEGTACVSDTLGNLLFYTSDDTVWNKSHLIMANGTGLKGLVTSDQAALIIKQPGNNKLYFIFTTEGIGGPGGLEYNVVDMSLAAGMGSVTVKNVLLVTPICEKLTATRHCNGVDVWVVAHDQGSNVFRSYLVNASGVSTTPVLSAVGTVLAFPLDLQTPYAGGTQGNMKISPDGRRLAFADVDLGTYELYDFDNTSGMVSNQLVLSNTTISYNIEFSPDGTKLYGSTWGIGPVYQWNLCAGSNASIINSQYTVTSVGGVAGLQVGPDGKIYGATGPQATRLCVINNPNNAGSTCNYSGFGPSFALGKIQSSLPNCMMSPVRPPFTFPPFTYTASSFPICQKVSFSSDSVSPSLCGATGPSITSWVWSFGDPASGIANTSSLVNPVHIYSAPGTYSVQLIISTPCLSDTLRQTVTTVTEDVLFSCSPYQCVGQEKALAAVVGVPGPFNYTWTPSAQSVSVATNLNPGVYTVTIVDGAGCIHSGTVDVPVPVYAQPTVTAINSGPICQTRSLLLIANGSGITYKWEGPDGYAANQQNALLNTSIASASGIYTVTMLDTNNCYAIATTSVIILVSPVAYANPAIGCTGQQINLSATGGTNCSWAGPQSFQAIGESVDFVAEGPSMTGIYTVTIVGSSNCSGTATVQVSIHSLPGGNLTGPPDGCAPFCDTLVLNRDSANAPLISTLFHVNGDSYPASRMFYCFKNAGNYLINVMYTDSNNCTNSSTLSVKAYEKPSADFDFVLLKPLAGLDKVTFVNASSGIDQISWIWFFDDKSNDSLVGQRISRLFDTAGNYTVALVVKTKRGCGDTAIKTLHIESEFSLFVPNAFTPNGDGLNDVFLPKGTGIKRYQLQIFDRWGAKLFQTSDFQTHWDGIFHGTICKEDTYIWKISLLASDGRSKDVQGTVTLLK